MPGKTQWKALFVHAPIGVILFSAYALLHLEYRGLQPAQPQLAYTALFPLLSVALFIWFRCRATGMDVIPTTLYVLLACVVAPLLVLFIPAIPGVRSVSASKVVYEVLQFGFLIALAVHCICRRGIWMFILFFVAGAIYGLALENGGISMGFFREEGYRIYIRPLLPGPLVTGLGWCIGLYAISHFAEHVTSTATPVWLRTTIAVAVGIGMDLQIDPLAVHCGWWEWHQSLPSFHHGVPLINYISWGCALTPFSWHYFAMLRRQVSERRRALLTLACVPLYLAVSGALELAATLLFCGPASPGMRLFLKAGNDLLAAVLELAH